MESNPRLFFKAIPSDHKLIEAYVSKADHDVLNAKAKAAGMSLSAYAAKVLTGHATH